MARAFDDKCVVPLTFTSYPSRSSEYAALRKNERRTTGRKVDVVVTPIPARLFHFALRATFAVHVRVTRALPFAAFLTDSRLGLDFGIR